MSITVRLIFHKSRCNINRKGLSRQGWLKQCCSTMPPYNSFTFSLQFYFPSNTLKKENIKMQCQLCNIIDSFLHNMKMKSIMFYQKNNLGKQKSFTTYYKFIFILLLLKQRKYTYQLFMALLYSVQGGCLLIWSDMEQCWRQVYPCYLCETGTTSREISTTLQSDGNQTKMSVWRKLIVNNVRR